MPDRIEELVGLLPASARLPLLVCLISYVAWAVLRLAVLVATRPRPPHPGPATQDLPGEEPPALVSVLAGGWSVTEDAAESTLLDLAARGYFELRQPDADVRTTTIHVTAEDPVAAAAAAARQARVLRSTGGRAPLTDYEQQVLDHVKHTTVGGMVPLTALTFREESRARGWAATFARSVMKDARRRGLVQSRVPIWAVTMMGAAALLPALATSWFVWTASSSREGGALFTGIVPLGILTTIAGRKLGYRGSPAGMALAAQWLGVREYLQVDTSFGGLPPAAVAVWDRYLAYGDALGVTPVCSAAIDLGMGNRRRVWSSFGGRWHQVRVRYPSAASRYGTSAPALVGAGVVQVALGYGLLLLSGSSGPDVWSHVPSYVAPTLLVVALALASRGLYRTVRALIDLATQRTMTAEVLWIAPWRTRTSEDTTTVLTYYLAVDDGSDDRTTAWALPAATPRPFDAGQEIMLTVRPWSRRVTAVAVRAADAVGPVPAGWPASTGPLGATPAPTPVALAGAAAVLPLAVAAALQPPPPERAAAAGPRPAETATERFAPPAVTRRMPAPGRPAPAQAMPSEAAAPPLVIPGTPAGPELLTSAELSSWFGLPLRPGQSLPVGPSTSAWSFRAAEEGRGAVLVSAGRGAADTMALDRARQGTPVPGLGEEAYLVAGGGVARWGSVVVQVSAPAELGVGRDALLAALQTAVLRVAKQRTG